MIEAVALAAAFWLGSGHGAVVTAWVLRPEVRAARALDEPLRHLWRRS